MSARLHLNPAGISLKTMAFELEGTLKVIMDTQTFGSGFTKREFVVTTGDDRYPQDIKMEFVKDKTALLDKYKTGQRVKIGFDLRGGEHNGRYYVNVQAWRIHPADGTESSGDGGGENRSSEPRSSGPPPGGGGGARPDRPRPERTFDDLGGRGDRGDRGDRGRQDRGEGRPRRQEPEFRGGRRNIVNDEDDIDF
jgi:hypothetical protein